MNDAPTGGELVEAVRHFLETEVLPALTEPGLRFRMLVAAHVLGIVVREWPVEEDMLRHEWELLAGLLDDPGSLPGGLEELRRQVRAANDRLCARIRTGDFDNPDRFRTLAQLLRSLVVAKLKVSNPRYLEGR